MAGALTFPWETKAFTARWPAMTHIRAWLTALFTATFAIAPALTSPFSGFAADQLPDPQIDPPVQPAGYAFSIWGLIYAWLVISALYGLWKRRDDAAWDRARAPLIASLAIGTPWLAIANASPVWATITIFLMAVFAIAALLRAPAKDYWFFAAPVAIYAGWLTAASFVSLGSTAAGFNIAFEETGWAYAAILGALVVAAGVLWRSGAWPYALTVVWALVGIMVANGTAQLGVTLLAGAGALAVLALAAKAPSGRWAAS